MTLEKLKVEASKADGDVSLNVPQQHTLAAWQEDADLNVVGQGPSRLEGAEKVTGRARYTTDIRLSGQLYAAVLRCPHPHAKVVSVNTDAAEALPGVHAVLSCNDAIDITWYKEGSPLFARQARFAGEEVAVVAAQSEEIAEDALRVIRVEYERLPHTATLAAAQAEDAAAVHAGGNKVDDPDVYERGDVAAGWRTAEVNVEATYTTQTALHNCFEAHATTAEWKGDELTLYESTQGIYDVRQMVAEKLGLSMHNVRIITEHMGGGFGSKQVPWKQAVFAALLAQKSGRPVQLVLDREGENLATGNRNPSWQRVKLGARRNGTLTAIEIRAVLATGAYQAAGEVSNIIGLCQDVYRCSNVRAEQTNLYTHTGPAVAFRAPGYVEAAFALESAMDELAHKLDMDPLALRRKNYADKDQKKGQPWSSPHGLKACYDRLDAVFDWTAYKKPAANGSKVRGIGLAAHNWIAGMGKPPAYAWIKLNVDGSADVITGTQDIGTGTRTVMAQVAAESIGLALASIRLQLGDTAVGPPAPGSQGSFTVPTVAPAVRMAGEDLRAQILHSAALLLDIDNDKNVAGLRLADGKIFRGDSGEAVLSVADVAAKLAPHSLQGHGARHANPEGTTIRPFGAQAAEVEVDTETGEVTLLRIVSAPDCGRIVNRKLANSQVIGGVTQGIGYALSEERVVDERLGIVLNANLEEYKIATVADIPVITHAEVDLPDLNANPTGSKGLGELPLIPAAPAIVNAIFDATGLRIRDLPVSRAKILLAMSEQKNTKESVQ